MVLWSTLISITGSEGLAYVFMHAISRGLTFHLQEMEEQLSAEDGMDGDHGDEDEDVEMDFGEETGSEGTSATDEDEEEQEDPDDEEGDSEEDDWHDEDEDEDLLEEDEENRPPEADGQVDPDVDVDGVWEVRRWLPIQDGIVHT
jgi:hypothetical protein